MQPQVDREADQTDSSGQEYLIFTLADQEYGIDILKVQEIRGYDAQTVTRDRKSVV